VVDTKNRHGSSGPRRLYASRRYSNDHACEQQSSKEQMIKLIFLESS